MLFVKSDYIDIICGYLFIKKLFLVFGSYDFIVWFVLVIRW